MAHDDTVRRLTSEKAQFRRRASAVPNLIAITWTVWNALMSGCDSWCHHSSSNDNDHTNISMEGPICRPDGHKLKRYKLKEAKAKWTTEIAFCVKINTSHYDWCQPCQAIIRTEKSETRCQSSKGTKRRRGQVPPISRQEIRMQIRKSKGLKLQIEERRSQMKQKETKKKEQAVRNIWLSEVKWRGWKPT